VPRRCLSWTWEILEERVLTWQTFAKIVSAGAASAEEALQLHSSRIAPRYAMREAVGSSPSHLATPGR